MEYIEKLKQDIADLIELSQAERCHKCGRFYVPGYVCPHCDTDNSILEDDGS